MISMHEKFCRDINRSSEQIFSQIIETRSKRPAFIHIHQNSNNLKMLILLFWQQNQKKILVAGCFLVIAFFISMENQNLNK